MRSKNHNDFMNKSSIKLQSFLLHWKYRATPSKIYIKVRLYIRYPENHLVVDKAVSDDKNGFFWGGESGRTAEKWKAAGLCIQKSARVYKYRVHCQSFNSSEDVHYVLVHITCRLVSKGKAVPLQAWSGPEGSRKLRFLDFMTTAQDDAKVVSLTHRPPLPPGKRPGTRFC